MGDAGAGQRQSGGVGGSHGFTVLGKGVNSYRSASSGHDAFVLHAKTIDHVLDYDTCVLSTGEGQPGSARGTHGVRVHSKVIASHWPASTGHDAFVLHAGTNGHVLDCDTCVLSAGEGQPGSARRTHGVTVHSKCITSHWPASCIQQSLSTMCLVLNSGQRQPGGVGGSHCVTIQIQCFPMQWALLNKSDS